MEASLQPKAHKTLSFLHEKSIRSSFLCHQSSLCHLPLSLAFSFFISPLPRSEKLAPALLFPAQHLWSPNHHQHGPCHLDLLHVSFLVAAFMPKGRSPFLTKSHSRIILEMPPCFNL